ncbi:MAG: ComF family protein [Clostridia bacterium]|nr:ComF family protein [Clostridia bacterium]
MANKLNLSLENKCLYKTQNIIEQSKLNKQEREKNILGAYSLLHTGKLQNKKILLIDDIFTTGSTVNECCKTIKNNSKPKEICVLTIAKD